MVLRAPCDVPRPWRVCLTLPPAPCSARFDLTNSTAYDLSYPIVSNPDALRVNQAWNGDPGRIVFNSTTTFTIILNL